MNAPTADLVLVNGDIYTGARSAPWVQGIAVKEGTVVGLGDSAQVREYADTSTRVVDLEGQFVMPALADVHIHLGLGGSMLRWDLPVDPEAGLTEVLDRVRSASAAAQPGEWIVGGAVGSALVESLSRDHSALLALDDASANHPVLLRDDTMHNRWVNSLGLAAMGVTDDTPDPDGGIYVRDDQGRLTGWLFELVPSAQAEAAFLASVPDQAARDRESVAAAVAALNAVGVVTVQDAGSMSYLFPALQSLEQVGELTIRVVTSTPMRPFVEPGETGIALAAEAASFRSSRIRPDFVKFFMDGVPMTRTAALVAPYVAHGHDEAPGFRGEPNWTHADLVGALRNIAEGGLGAKLHATGDGAVRAILDAVEAIRDEFPSLAVQIAHIGLIDDADIPRLAQLGVSVDASPHMWFPNAFLDAAAHQISASRVRRSYPNRTMRNAGALVAAGSDWPVGAPTPSPWIGLQTIVTRRNPDPSVEGALGPEEALTVAEAIEAFTSAPAEAMGLADVTGRLEIGKSADFIVLDRNPFNLEPATLMDTKVLATWFEGREVHRA